MKKVIAGISIISVFWLPLFSGPKNDRVQEKKYYLYLKATYQHMRGEMQEALESFKYLLNNNPPVDAYDGFVKFLFDANQFEAIAQIPDSIWLKFNDNLEVQLILAKALIQTNRAAQSSKYLTYLSVKYPEDEQVLYYSAMLQLQLGNKDKALLLVDRALSNPALEHKSFLFYHLKSKILVAQGDHKNALVLAQKSVKLFPRFAKGWLFKAMLAQQVGQVNDAIHGFTRFLDLVGSNEAVEKQLVGLLFNEGKYQEAEEHLKKAAAANPARYLDLALFKWKMGNQHEAMQCVDKLLALKKNFTKGKLLKLEIFLSQKAFDKALDYMSAWLLEKPHDKIALQTMLLLPNAGIAKQKVTTVLEKAAQKDEVSSRTLLALADFYMQDKQFDPARDLYEKLLTRAKTSLMRSKIYFAIGHINFALHEYDKVEEPLLKAIHEQPAYPDAYNLLAYHYAQSKDESKLKEALDLVDRAIESNPKSPYYLDTKGCILIKLGEKKKAEHLLMKAHQLAGGKDKVILEHLKMVKGG